METSTTIARKKGSFMEWSIGFVIAFVGLFAMCAAAAAFAKKTQAATGATDDGTFSLLYVGGLFAIVVVVGWVISLFR
jgi:hypothetical protein